MKQSLGKLLPSSRIPPASAVARGLGWFSVGLGVCELLMARSLARSMGVRSSTLMRAYGLREIATGVAILTSARPAPYVWARVGGDALDMATLGAEIADGRGRKAGAFLALGMVAGVTAVDVGTARALGRAEKTTASPRRDYRNRSGFNRPVEEMRGIARDADMPRDMRTPPALVYAPTNT